MVCRSQLLLAHVSQLYTHLFLIMLYWLGEIGYGDSTYWLLKFYQHTIEKKHTKLKMKKNLYNYILKVVLDFIALLCILNPSASFILHDVSSIMSLQDIE